LLRARPADGLLERPSLQAVVDAGIRRDAEALAVYLDDPDPIVRGRAVYTLASVQSSTTRPRLIELLSDPADGIRADAAFALGLLPGAESAAALLAALDAEGVAGVRTLILEAIGRTGELEALERLLERAGRDDAEGHALALFHFGRRGTYSTRAAPLLLSLIASTDTVVQEIAALTLAGARTPDLWGVTAAQLRSVLEAAGDANPAAGALATALANAGEDEDAARLVRWLERGARWRTRLQAAESLSRWVERAEVLQALKRAIDDSSTHVAMTAARVLADAPDTDPRELRMWMEQNPERWTVAGVLLTHEEIAKDTAFVMQQLREAIALGAPRWAGYASFAASRDARSLEALLAGLASLERRTRYAAAAALGRRIEDYPPDAPERDRIAAALASRLDSWGPMATGSDLRGPLAVLEATSGDGGPGAAELHARAGRHLHPGMRAGARAPNASAHAQAGIPPGIDWEWLKARGAKPRIRFETVRGVFTVELDVEAAPLTAMTVMRYVHEGRYDGLTFHRVEANFILQSGDFDNAHGSGGPDAALRTESTRIPFLRGTMGMASAGRDSEGSQFFVTHGASPSLDGRYTAFGRVVSGITVADAIVQGDSVFRVIVE